MRFALVVPIALLSLAADQPIRTARELVEAMRERYDDKWYRTLTFVQENTATAPDGKVERTTWREWLVLPGRLRIEFEPADSGNGMLFVNDSQYVFRRDSVLRGRPFVHPLLVLGFDVYSLPAERTMALLQHQGFDLSVMHEDTWENRPVYVVGAKPGDHHSKQFWIDQERLVFVRLLEPAPQDTTKTSEIRFGKYAPLGGGWIAPEVEFLLDGQQRFLEQYHDTKADIPLAQELFDAGRWKAARSRR